MLTINLLFSALNVIMLISYCFSQTTQTSDELYIEDLCSQDSELLSVKKAFLMDDTIGLFVDYNHSSYVIAISGLKFADNELTTDSVQLWNDWDTDINDTEYKILANFVFVFRLYDHLPLPLVFVTKKYNIKVEFIITSLSTWSLSSVSDLRDDFEDEKAMNKIYQLKLKRTFGKFSPPPVFLLFPTNDKYLPQRAFVYFNDLEDDKRRLYVMLYKPEMTDWFFDDGSGFTDSIVLNDDDGIVMAALPITGYLSDEDDPTAKHFQIIEILSDGQFRIRIIYIETNVVLETRRIPSKVAYDTSKVVYNGNVRELIDCPTPSTPSSTIDTMETIINSSEPLPAKSKASEQNSDKKLNKKLVIILIIVIVLIILAVIIIICCCVRHRRKQAKRNESKTQSKPIPKVSKPEPKVTKTEPKVTKTEHETVRSELKLDKDTEPDKSDTTSVKSLDKTAANRISELTVFFTPPEEKMKIASKGGKNKESPPKEQKKIASKGKTKEYDESMSYSLDGVKRK